MAESRAKLRACCALLLAGAAPALAVELSPREREGKRIFLSGESPSGAPVTARLGRGGDALPASALPCASCHGEDALGRTEGGARAPSITWSELSKPYGHVHPGGRKHPPFDPRSFARAVAAGVDPAGAALDGAMPRYDFSQRDLASLVAYLRRVAEDLDPGISAAELRVGTVLPASGPGAGAGREMRAAMEARLAALNAAGGLHGRRLRLEVAEYDAAGGAGAALAAARDLVLGGRVLALVGGLFPAAEREIFALADEARIPLVGPFTLHASAAGASPWVFHLLAGIGEQAHVLVDFAAERLGTARPRAAVVHVGEGRLGDAARAARARLEERAFRDVELVSLGSAPGTAEVAARLAREGVEVVVFLGGDAELSALTAAANARGWRPQLLLPGGLAPRAAIGAPRSLDGRVFLAYPTLPSDERPGARRWQAREAGAAALQAEAAVALLAEGLRRAGRAVGRKALVASLEGLWQLDVGLVPPLTYGPSRRVGALGAHVVAADVAARAFRPLGGFRSLETAR